MQCIMLRFISYLLFFIIKYYPFYAFILQGEYCGAIRYWHPRIQKPSPATRTQSRVPLLAHLKPSPATRIFYATTSMKDVAYRTYIAATCLKDTGYQHDSIYPVL
jgi:hypothetical protein